MSDTPTETKDEAAAKLESGKSHAKQAARDIRGAAEAKAQDLKDTAEHKANELRGRAEQAYEQALVRARTLQKDGEHYVRENPMRGVLTALGVGFVLGLLFRR